MNDDLTVHRHDHGGIETENAQDSTAEPAGPTRIEDRPGTSGHGRVEAGQVLLGVVAVLVAGIVATRETLGADRVGLDLTAAQWMFALGAVFLVVGLVGTLARRRP